MCGVCAGASNMADDLKISVQFRYFQYSPLLCRFYSINVFLNGVELFFRILSFFSFSGGAELLFNKVKDHEVVLPKNENPCESPPPPPPPPPPFCWYTSPSMLIWRIWWCMKITSSLLFHYFGPRSRPASLLGRLSLEAGQKKCNTGS